ncbi:unnamed protein product [Brassica oleracea]
MGKGSGMITVDGDMSTNGTVIALASGLLDHLLYIL